MAPPAALTKLTADASTHPAPNKWADLWQRASQALFDKDPGALAGLIHTWLTVAQLPSTAQILAITQSLHDKLLALHESSETQLQICKACEAYFTTGNSAPQLATQLVPTLVLHALQKDALVSRLYQCRSALSCLDLDDESADLLHQLLLRCFVSPGFLSKAQGRKFLGFTMTASPRLLQDVHQIFKAQLEHLARHGASSAVAADTIEAFADVYYEAWRASPAAVEPVLQELMEASLLLANAQLVKQVWRLLAAALFTKKQERSVDLALARLYEPLLWRALAASNSTVRANAGTVLGNVFPLPGNTLQESSALVHKQFAALDALLEDPAPAVRVVAVQAAARILAVFWETIPARRASDLLQRLVNDLAHDATSAAVRAAVLQSLAYMTGEPLALPALKQALPHLRASIHDKSPTVRAAAAEMLQAVAKVRGWRYRDVVPVEHVLERLALDAQQPAVAAALTQLLLPSVYPQEADGADQLFKAKRVAVSHPRAARALFSNLHLVVPVEKVCKLALLFARYLRAVLKSGEPAGEEADAVGPCADALQSLVASVWRKVAAHERFAEAKQELVLALAPDDLCIKLLGASTAAAAAWKLAAAVPYAAGTCARMEARAMEALESNSGDDSDDDAVDGDVVALLAAWSRLDALLGQCADALAQHKGSKKSRSALSPAKASRVVQAVMASPGGAKALLAHAGLRKLAEQAYAPASTGFALAVVALKLSALHALAAHAKRAGEAGDDEDDGGGDKLCAMPAALAAALGADGGRHPALLQAVLADAARSGVDVPGEALSKLAASPVSPHLALAMAVHRPLVVLDWLLAGGAHDVPDAHGLVHRLLAGSKELFLAYCARVDALDPALDAAKLCAVALRQVADPRARKMLALVAPKVQPAPAKAKDALARYAGCPDAYAASRAWGLA